MLSDKEFCEARNDLRRSKIEAFQMHLVHKEAGHCWQLSQTQCPHTVIVGFVAIAFVRPVVNATNAWRQLNAIHRQPTLCARQQLNISAHMVFNVAVNACR